MLAAALTCRSHDLVSDVVYFTLARGKERVAIVREKGTNIPEDLGSVIYLCLEDRGRLSGVKRELVRFLDKEL